jgi:hypothetical protein
VLLVDRGSELFALIEGVVPVCLTACDHSIMHLVMYVRLFFIFLFLLNNCMLRCI